MGHACSVSRKEKKEEILIVIISNSQGYAREISDESTYSSLLEKQFAVKRGKKVRVLNWSIPGGVAPEFAVLLAAAIRLEPDVFLFISSPTNFEKKWMKLREDGSRKIWASDSYQLIGFSNIRKYLPQQFLSHFFRPIDYLYIYFERFSKPLMYKELLISKLMKVEWLRPFEKYPDAENWFFKAAPSREKYREEYANFLKSEISNDKQRKKVIGENEVSQELIDYFFNVSDKLTGKKIYISMPIHSVKSNKDILLRDEFSGKFEAEGFVVKDFSQKIPDNHFITLTHFDESGHSIMAMLLSDLVIQ